MKYKTLNSFITGEVDTTLLGRTDYQKQASACRELTNFILQPHGGAYKRPGTEYIGDLPGKSRLFSFQLAADVSFILVFSDQLIQVVADKGFVLDASLNPVEVVSPYAEADIDELYVTQSSTSMYICHPGYQVRKLTPSDATTWVLEELDFGASIPVPACTAISFSKTPTNSYTQKYKLVGYTPEGGESDVVDSPNLEVTTEEPDYWIAGSYVQFSITKPVGISQIDIYKEKAGYYGLVGIIEGDPDVEETGVSWRDENYFPNTAIQPSVKYNPFTDTYPEVAEFYQQRLYYGYEQTIWGSRIGLFDNFNKRSPSSSDDSVEFDLDTGDLNAIKWMSTKNSLLIGTEGSEWVVSGVAGLTVTPTSIQSTKQASWGSEKIKPLIIGNEMLHVQRGGRSIRELTYSVESSGYNGLDRTVLATQIFRPRKIRSWVHQRVPYPVVWCVMDDGILAAMTYVKEQDVWGWHKHETTGGTFESISAVPNTGTDDIYVVVNRGGVYRLEVFGPKWEEDITQANFLDSSLRYEGTPVTHVTGLDHLEGEEVSALIDGSVHGPFTVSSGGVTLSREGSNILIGLNYESVLSPLVVETEDDKGSTFGRQRAVPSVTFLFDSTVGGKYGQEKSDLIPFKYSPDKYGQAIEPYTGRKDASLPTRDLSDGTFYVVQDQPLPMTILAAMVEFSAGG